MALHNNSKLFFIFFLSLLLPCHLAQPEVSPSPAPESSSESEPDSSPSPGPTSASSPSPGPSPAATPSSSSSPSPGPASGPTQSSGTSPGPSPSSGSAPGPASGPAQSSGPSPGPSPSSGSAPGPSPSSGSAPGPASGPAQSSGPSPGPSPSSRSAPGPSPSSGSAPGPSPSSGPAPGPSPSSGPAPGPSSDDDDIDDEVSSGSAPGPSPSSGPAPGPSSDDDDIDDEVDIQQDSISLPPSFSETPSPSMAPSPSADAPSDSDSPIEFDFSPTLAPTADVDPQVKKICNSTDYSSLCLATVSPYLDGKTDISAVLDVAIQAGVQFSKYGQATAQKLAGNPGNPPELVSALNECMDSFESAVENFAKASDALPEHDKGTVNTMLSAVITYAGDCHDSISKDSPLYNITDRLMNMASNCLALSSLMN